MITLFWILYKYVNIDKIGSKDHGVKAPVYVKEQCEQGPILYYAIY